MNPEDKFSDSPIVDLVAYNISGTAEVKLKHKNTLSFFSIIHNENEALQD